MVYFDLDDCLGIGVEGGVMARDGFETALEIVVALIVVESLADEAVEVMVIDVGACSNDPRMRWIPSR